MNNSLFFDRDISWLSFNERLLVEAANDDVPLMERFKFLAIYSSNLDEFYRVRMPALLAVEKIEKAGLQSSVYRQATDIIHRQQMRFGIILSTSLIPRLNKAGYFFVDKDNMPGSILPQITQYFFTTVAGLLQPVVLQEGSNFFPENNLLYLSVVVEEPGGEELLYLVNVPCNVLPRFYRISENDTHYLIYLEDIIAINLACLFEGKVSNVHNIKITRDAELELQDEYGEDLAEKIEKQLKKRDMGFATRFLYQPGIPLRHLQNIIQTFNLHKASVMEGGYHHNLKDLLTLPVQGNGLSYPAWPATERIVYESPGTTLFEKISEADRMIHAPYENYDAILRFFNEAAINKSVEAIYTTLYRVANDSRIVQALISAVRNGKRVTVMVELKARFDEANNIQWTRRMKAAGVTILHSDNKIKVHAKVALIKRKHSTRPYLGLLATGNLNESTARFYTDHILLTAHQEMLQELLLLFNFFTKGKKISKDDKIDFKHLLVAQFNLQETFLKLIDREINHAKNGLPASIIIKLNNLEEEKLILKLYEASNAGVEIDLIVRSICRLVPGVPNQSRHIRVRRIVDRYLEHGRIFLFANNNMPEIFMGSADWMNRNIYHRIEVCFPVYDEEIKKETAGIINLQLQDNVKAVWISDTLRNMPVEMNGTPVRSQEAIHHFLQP